MDILVTTNLRTGCSGGCRGSYSDRAAGVSGNTARVLVRAVPDGTPTAHVIRQLDIAAVAAAGTKQFAQPTSVVQF